MTSKYKILTILKETKSRTFHICSKCGSDILPKEMYYVEYIEDKFLHNLNAKKFCSKCYNEYGEKLIK